VLASSPVQRRRSRSVGMLVAGFGLAVVSLATLGVPAAAAGQRGRDAAAAGAVVSNADRTPRPPKNENNGRHPHAGTTPIDIEPPPPTPGDRLEVLPALNLFKLAGFRYQDTNFYACTATSVQNMLNFIAIGGRGGTGFRWSVNLTATRRDALLVWERTHDTLAGGNGSDPHGWRNALNYYGWGAAALLEGSRVYEDYQFSSYERAMKGAVRTIVRTRKPVGIAAWAGQHAQVITGYDGLVGDPFERDASGAYTNAFTFAAVYLSDPLKADASMNRRFTYGSLASTTNLTFRFRRYLETDSPYDDGYTPGWVRARDEWYGRWVIVAPIR
jgi:hypothetical protein